MTIAEAIYQHSLRLPEPAAREVLDFIEFLEVRYGLVDLSAGQGPADEAVRREALARLGQVRIPWDGKPIPDRAALCP